MGDTTRLADAAGFVTAAFHGIVRKGTSIPYVTHLYAVAAIVGENGGDEEQMTAALLHDWLEDIPGASETALRQRFGNRVADIVVALTDTVEHPKPPWRQRKEAHIAHLRQASADIRLVCAADKLHNARSIIRDLNRDGITTFARFAGGAVGTSWYFCAISEMLTEGWPHPLGGLLADAAAEIRLKVGTVSAD